MFKTKKHLQPVPSVTAETIAAEFSKQLNAHLNANVSSYNKAYAVDLRAPDALIMRRTYLDLAHFAYESALITWELAKSCGIADMLDIDPALITTFQQVKSPLEARSKAA